MTDQLSAANIATMDTRYPLLAMAICLSGCGGSIVGDTPVLGQCWTADGMAYWSGLCKLGKAQGKGTARYENTGIESIAATFENGIPLGDVTLRYSGGGTYVGGYKEGEPNGFGTLTEAWGEGYRGGWQAGFRHGDGVFTRQDGTNISGTWANGELLGAWYADNDSGCRVWWSPGSDPVGDLSWSGACVAGKAAGFGKIEWHDSSSPPVVHVIEFEGRLARGLLHGEGTWKSEDRFSNVTHRTVRRGHWLDGFRTGEATDIKISDYHEGEFTYVWEFVSGHFERGKIHGFARRMNTKTSRSGLRETLTEHGIFKDGRLETGTQVRERIDNQGHGSLTLESGRFANTQYAGHGSVVQQHSSSEGSTSAIVSYAGALTEGGQGSLVYADGDVFFGRFKGHPDMPPVLGKLSGQCVLQSSRFIGDCESHSDKVSSYETTICLVPPRDREHCLKEIGWSVS